MRPNFFLMYLPYHTNNPDTQHRIVQAHVRLITRTPNKYLNISFQSELFIKIFNGLIFVHLYSMTLLHFHLIMYLYSNVISV